MKAAKFVKSHYLNFDYSDNFLSNDLLSYKVQLPYPISKPFEAANIDKIAQYHEDIEKRNSRLVSLSSDFKKLEKNLSKQDFTDSHVTITKGILDFCQNDKKDFEFNSDYNPFYLPGLLTHLLWNGQSYLIRADSNNKLRYCKVSHNWKNRKLKFNKTLGSDITSLDSFSNGNTCLLLLKHKKEFNLLKIEALNEISSVVWEKHLTRPLIDAKITTNQIGLIQSNFKLNLYNIESTKKITKIRNVSTFDFIDDKSIAVLNENDFKLWDLRSNQYQQFSPSNKLKCNYLNCMKIKDNILYLATRHYLIRSDIRFFKNTEFCSHLMKYSPCYIDLYDDCLCLASQKPEDKVLFYGNPINSLPVHVPNIADTYQQCRLQNNLLLKNYIGKRLQKSIGGIKILSSDNGLFLYSVNFNGDLFTQNCHENKNNLEALEKFYKWSSQVPVEQPSINVTDFVNLSDVCRALEHTNNVKTSVDKTNKCNLFMKNFSNKFQTASLSEAARNFASIWDDEENVEQNPNMNLVPEVASLEKVNKWIESSSFFE